MLGRLGQLICADNFQFSTIVFSKIAGCRITVFFVYFFLNFGEAVFRGVLIVFVRLVILAGVFPFILAGVLAFLVLVVSYSIVGVVVWRGGRGVCGRVVAAFCFCSKSFIFSKNSGHFLFLGLGRVGVWAARVGAELL